jgi:hypothetical protein
MPTERPEAVTKEMLFEATMSIQDAVRRFGEDLLEVKETLDRIDAHFARILGKHGQK